MKGILMEQSKTESSTKPELKLEDVLAYKKEKKAKKSTSKEKVVKKQTTKTNVVTNKNSLKKEPPISKNFKRFKSITEKKSPLTKEFAIACYNLIEAIRFAVGMPHSKDWRETLKWIKNEFKENQEGYLSPKKLPAVEWVWLNSYDSKQAFLTFIAIMMSLAVDDTLPLDKKRINYMFKDKYQLLGERVGEFI
jgi:hypothetical protein